ncbi:MAG: UDP-N-acetylmuramoyl-tripeptide--D-alanyl-D-alanine ligase [Candidatus Nealsonbacteria bacterium]|nr:UDP-N-acetylmuramoyl-tripeptide--D-alanyl-D-alanine ligase [Candidatus Nealsonbacteria bacterium]
MFFVFFFTAIWLIAASKNILFWIYLWQLKEYHIGRFLAHFQVEKGRKLLFNKLLFFKIFLVSFFLFIFIWSFRGEKGSALFVLIALKLAALSAIVYFLESARAVKNLFQKKIKVPVLTFKTAFLILAGISLEVVFVSSFLKGVGENYPIFILGLLLFDVLIPLIISVIVLFFQPLAVLRKRQTISRAKRKRRQFKDLIVIGITGSYGKTSTKEFLATILSQKFNVLKTKEHQNSEMGISQCILNDLKPEHQVFIVEMGAYNKWGIKLLCDIVRPKIGILTGINEQHLATFGSQENIIKTKFELIESLPKEGAAILNYDNQHIRARIKDPNYKPEVENQILYSTQEEIDIWAKDISVEKNSITFNVFSKQGESASFSADVLGGYNASNILAAIAAAKEMGMDLKEIVSAVKKIEIGQWAMVLKKNKSGLNIIDFTYSANFDGVISALEYLKVWPGRRAIIMPCLIELDTASGSVHERIGEKIAEVCELAIITTKDCFNEIKKGAMENKMNSENILLEEYPEKILEKVKGFNEKNDIILLEGRMAKEIIDTLLQE